MRYSAESRLSHDHFLQLDRMLASFWRDLDAKVGKDNYVVVLTADHGFMPAVEYSAQQGLPSGRVDGTQVMANLNKGLEPRFGPGKWVMGYSGSSLLMDKKLISQKGQDAAAVADAARALLLLEPGFAAAYTRAELQSSSRASEPLFTPLQNAWHPDVSGDVQYALKPNWRFGVRSNGTTHGSPYDYDTHVPILLYGPRWIGKGRIDKRVEVVDIASTLADLLMVPPPGAAEGQQPALCTCQGRSAQTLIGGGDGPALRSLDVIHSSACNVPNRTGTRKRYAWILSFLVPCLVGFGPLLMVVTGNVLAPCGFRLFFFYCVAPLLDWLMGEDLSNPPESCGDSAGLPTCITAASPTHWCRFSGLRSFSAHGLWCITTCPCTAWWPWCLITGSVGGFCINLGHELGHKNTSLERWLAKIVLAPTFYGHFFIEHNRGHHRDVATPRDPASSRMGESIYRFVLREMPGAFRRAWTLESTRLRQAGQPVWSFNNEILQPALITVALWTTLVLWLRSTDTAVSGGGIVLGQLSAHVGQLHRALWFAAPGARAGQV
jgi:hypothetical protein